MLVSIGELLLDAPEGAEGQLRIDEAPGLGDSAGGPAAAFCTWAARLGEPARLLTWVAAGPGGDRLVEELEARGFEVRAVRGRDLAEAALEESWLEDAQVLHLPGASLLQEPLAAAARRALMHVRGRRGLAAVDLSTDHDLSTYGGARLAFELAKLRPDVLLAGESAARELGVPLEGLARLPVLMLGERGCEIFGRRVPAPPGAGAQGPAFAAALCSAYLDGAMPIEAAGRAMVYAAQAARRQGPAPPAH